MPDWASVCLEVRAPRCAAGISSPKEAGTTLGLPSSLPSSSALSLQVRSFPCSVRSPGLFWGLGRLGAEPRGMSSDRRAFTWGECWSQAAREGGTCLAVTLQGTHSCAAQTDGSSCAWAGGNRQNNRKGLSWRTVLV